MAPAKSDHPFFLLPFYGRTTCLRVRVGAPRFFDFLHIKTLTLPLAFAICFKGPNSAPRMTAKLPFIETKKWFQCHWQWMRCLRRCVPKSAVCPKRKSKTAGVATRVKFFSQIRLKRLRPKYFRVLLYFLYHFLSFNTCLLCIESPMWLSLTRTRPLLVSDSWEPWTTFKFWTNCVGNDKMVSTLFWNFLGGV